MTLQGSRVILYRKDFQLSIDEKGLDFRVKNLGQQLIRRCMSARITNEKRSERTYTPRFTACVHTAIFGKLSLKIPSLHYVRCSADTRK